MHMTYQYGGMYVCLHALVAFSLAASINLLEVYKHDDH